MEGYEPLAKALTETGGSPEGADGGFLVPQDFDDMIHEYEKEYVDPEPVLRCGKCTQPKRLAGRGEGQAQGSAQDHGDGHHRQG